jgi:hypothetical protein
MSHTPQRIKLSRQISEQMRADTLRYPSPDGFVDSDDDDQDTARWALRGHWLMDQLTDRLLPDGRAVLELVSAPIWVIPDGTEADYIEAVDAAMQRDSSWGAL